MTSPEIVEVSSLADIMSRMGDIVDKFLEKTVVVARGASFTLEEQIQVLNFFGETIGTYPNGSAGRLDIYTENHSRLSGEVSKDEVLVSWHLEHVETDNPYEVIVGGLWNMYKFSASPGSGNTYFVDTAKFLASLPKEHQDLLRDSVLTWSLGGNGPYVVPTVGVHWKTGEEVLRIPLNAPKHNMQVANLEGDPFTEDSKNALLDLIEHCIGEITTNEEIRVVHQWQEGDLVFVDLYKNAHAVAGGFDPEDREFTGIWMYSRDNQAGSNDT